MAVSDDFADGILDPVWQIEGPSGVSSALGTSAEDAYLELITPDGNYDAYNTNNGARAMQDTANTDLQIETRFLSTPTTKYQMQGLLVEQDASNWIRFDTHSDGKKLYAYAAVTVNGVSSTQFKVAIPGNVAPWLQMTRVGDEWTLAYSTNGTVWTVAGTFTHALTVTSTGVFAGNTGAATGFTAQVDYFENTATPIVGEDAAILPQAFAPVATDDSLQALQNTPLTFSASDLLANDTDANGDTLTISAIGQPANGTLVDNGDGTYTYTPSFGHSGADSFTYTLSDGTLTDTGSVNLIVGTPTFAISDDFSDGTLDPVWEFSGIAGSAQLGVAGAEAYVEITSPAGVQVSASDVLTTPRLMQAQSDTNFQISAGFLTEPATKYQEHGLLIVQDDQNWIRFDLAYTSSGLRLIVGIIEAGVTSYPLFVGIDSGVVKHLRITRDGIGYQFDYSADGNTWVTVKSLTHALTVSEVGVFAGSTLFDGPVPGYVAHVDYFENTATPIIDEDGTIAPPNQAPIAGDDLLSTAQNTALTFDAAALLANDSDPESSPVSILSTTQPGHGTLIKNADGTYTYTPATGYSGSDSFSYTVTDGTQTDTATVTLTVEPGSQPPVGLVSDDFAGGVLDPVWVVQGPAGTSASIGANATDAYLELVSPDGSFDIWKTNNGTRAMQVAENTDFQIETRFLSTPTAKYQIQGVLVEQDASNWVRFDTHSDGANLYAFAAVTVNGASAAKFKVAIPGNVAPWMQVTRIGDIWTLDYSTDGVTWTTAGSFSHALTVSAVGVIAGNTGIAPGFTALVDYFENTAAPIVDEDAVIVPPQYAPVAVDDVLTTAQDDAVTFNTADLLGNDTDQNGDVLSISAINQPANGTLVDNGDGTYTYTPATGYSGSDSFSYTVTDGTQTDTATVAVTVTGTSQPPVSSLVSDDFAGGVLDPVWVVQGPAGTSASIGANATDAYLELVSPDGSFDIWKTNNGTRAMQVAENTDFQIETRFLSTPTAKYQIQGVLVEQDASNWVRFDTHSDGANLYAFAAVTVNGASAAKFKVAIPGNVAPWMQVTRIGDIWTLDYSTDGVTWTTAGSFSHALTVSAVGVIAGNTGIAPGFTALVDYFENTAAPIVDEDATNIPGSIAPMAVDDLLMTEVNTPRVFSAADLLGNDTDQNGDTLVISAIGQPAHGTLVDNGDGTYTYTPATGYSGNDSFSYTVSDGALSDIGLVTVGIGNPINLWHGTEQSFGSPGEGQEWINILGNIAGTVTALSYSLNGGPAQALSLGPDTRRLQNPGDFNIDIAYSALNGTADDDVVTITATMSNGDIYSSQVTIDYVAGNQWSPNYSIDWATVGNIQDVVQVVDGTWSHDANGVRPVDLGYDRLLVLGDQSWDNYELNVAITIHDLDNEDPLGRDGGGFAIGMLWNGHNDSRFPDMQPLTGYEPGAAFFYTHLFKSHSYHSFSEVLGIQSMSLVEGLTYNFTVRVEQVGLYDRLYSLKVWQEGSSEPTGWTLQTLENFSITEAPATGSIYLNAHYNDVTFGDLSVTEITGRDIIQGDAQSETLVAVNPADAAPGRGEIDVFVGAAGADTFVFGDANGSYYDDGNAATEGTEDYGFVWDFSAGTDVVELHGSAADYVLTSDAAGLPAGTAIWLAGATNELVGVLNGVYGLDLDSPNFRYLDQVFT